MPSCPERLIAHFGTQAEAARNLGIRRSVVWSWKRWGYIPTSWAAVVEAATGRAITANEILAEALQVKPPAKIRLRDVSTNR